ncbi:Charged multivesicular body protein 1b [Taenia crassiceps]|uniref:Charged multivesicular body protein 1b n=1 Tax=Taenia crassiceps TaxID=6207 RepID=A0ABR4Q1U6_9CEST
MVSWFKKPTLEDQLFDLKFTSKQLLNFSKKCEKEEKAAKAQLKKSIQAGNMDCSRVYAENAIRKKNEALNYMRMSSRIDAVAARVQTAVTTQSVTASMRNVVNGMSAAMKSMNLEKVSTLMDQFEKEFESLDVQSQVMEGTMSNTTSLNAPSNEVDSLMRETADEAGIELDLNLPSGVTSTIGVPSATVPAEEQDLSDRLARLRQS